MYLHVSDLLFADEAQLTINSFMASGNTGPALNFSNANAFARVTSSMLSANQHGVHVASSAMRLVVTDSELTNNLENGLDLLDSQGRYEVVRSHVSGNTRAGVRNWNDVNACRRSENVTSLVVRDSTFARNGEYAVFFAHECSVLLHIENSFVTESPNGVLLELDMALNSEEHTTFAVRNTTFTRITNTSTDVSGDDSFEMYITDNLMRDNTGQLIRVHVDEGRYSSILKNILHFLRNVIESNSAVANLVEINCDNSNDQEREFIFANNTFQNNLLPQDVDPYFLSVVGIRQAVLAIRLQTGARIENNIFHNPGAPFELGTFDSDFRITHDARGNFWNVDDVTAISNRIYAANQFYPAAEVWFQPFRLDRDDVTAMSGESVQSPRLHARHKHAGRRRVRI